MSAALAVAAVLLFAASGVPGIFLGRASRTGERLAAAMAVLGGACGLAASALALASPEVPTLTLPWRIPGGELAIRVDAISAMFLAPISLLPALGAVYGLEYWPQPKHEGNGRRLRLAFGLLAAGLVMVLIAHNGVLFLLGWETMAMSAFFAVTAEDENPATREAGYLYLAATRMGTLCLFGFFMGLRAVTGSFALESVHGASPAAATALFLLGLVGFGMKAGIMPGHFWLPGAHANAPSHVSSVMSGVLIKVGVYGVVRTCSLFDAPPLWWGGLLLALGAVSGVLGVAFAIGQHDIKRLLAYHSIENIGIITLGLGLAMVGRAAGEPALVALGLAGALLHVWNHALFKGLLFLAAGAVVHETGTREIDELGGLLKKMPRTALLFLVGAVAISGLPPLNGFVSELLVYLGLFRGTVALPDGAGVASALGAAALALIGGLALACFVKVFGAVFLGHARSERTAHAHEPGASMLGPMSVLALLCAAIGIVPWAAAPALDKAVAAFGGARGVGGLRVLAPLGWVTWGAAVLAGLVALFGGILAWRLARAPKGASPTWDCGYLAPAATMQYSSSSFAQMLVDSFAWALRPQVERPVVKGLFPAPSSFHSHVGDTVLDGFIRPAARWIVNATDRIRAMQSATVNWYFAYVLAAVLAGLLWAAGGWR